MSWCCAGPATQSAFISPHDSDLMVLLAGVLACMPDQAGTHAVTSLSLTHTHVHKKLKTP